MNESKKILDTIMQAHNTQQMILPDGSLSSLNSISTRINGNAIYLGPSGGGKTRSGMIPNILAAFWSYVISDPKGTLYKSYGRYLRQCGYNVIHLDLIHPERSDGYNPLAFVKTSDDVLTFAHQLVHGGNSPKSSSSSYDPFWDNSAELMTIALTAFLLETNGNTTPKIEDMIKLTRLINAQQIEDENTCDLDKKMEAHNQQYRRIHGRESWAYSQWQKFRMAPPKTMNTILVCMTVLFNMFDTDGMRNLLGRNDIDLTRIGKEKTAVFVETSDTDRSKDVISNLFYSQAMTVLCDTANSFPDNRLPVPVRFFLDDFGSSARLVGFENMISNIRSRGISAVIAIQSFAQLYAGYGIHAQTIIDNCDTLLYMGGRDKSTVELISKLSNKPFNKIMDMPIGMFYKIQRGRPAEYGRIVDLSEYDLSFLQSDKDNKKDLVSA